MVLSKLELMGEKSLQKHFGKEKIKCGFKLQQKQKMFGIISCMKRSSEVQKNEVIKQW